MFQTIVLYQNPAASQDILNWATSLLQKGRMEKMDLTLSNKPRFQVLGPNGHEEVLCYPLDSLVSDEPPPAQADKLVIVGAVPPLLVDPLIHYMAHFHQGQ